VGWGGGWNRGGERMVEEIPRQFRHNRHKTQRKKREKIPENVESKQQQKPTKSSNQNKEEKKRGKMIKQPSVLFFLKIGEFLFYIYKK